MTRARRCDREAKRLLGSYRDVLTVPRAKSLVALGFLARSPIGFRALAVIFLVESEFGSYLLAGVAMACITVGQALAGPFLGRVADTYGANPLLVVGGALHAAAGIGFVVAVTTSAGLPAVFLLALLNGLTVLPIGALVRARWSTLTQDRPQSLRTAYALESFLDEIMYIGGPVLAALIAVTWSPSAGYTLAVLVTAVGALALAGAGLFPDVARTHAADGMHDRPRRWQLWSLAVWQTTGIPAVLAAYAGLGLFLGAVDVGIVALSDEQFEGHYAGVLLSLFAVASLASSLMLGATPGGSRQSWILPAAGVAMTLSALGCTALGSPLMLAVPILLGGLAISPVLILGSTAVKAVAPQGLLNEAFTWASSCVTVATGLGSLMSGWLIDRFSPAAGFAIAVTGGVTVLVTALRVPPESQKT
jgi:MFS family permease